MIKIIVVTFAIGFGLLTINGCLQTGLNPIEYWDAKKDELVDWIRTKLNRQGE